MKERLEENTSEQLRLETAVKCNGERKRYRHCFLRPFLNILLSEFLIYMLIHTKFLLSRYLSWTEWRISVAPSLSTLIFHLCSFQHSPLRHCVAPPPQRGEELFAQLKTDLLAHQCQQNTRKGASLLWSPWIFRYLFALNYLAAITRAISQTLFE